MTRSNRRDFLKRAGAVASGAALGAGALVGCGKGDGGASTAGGGAAGGAAATAASITHDLCVSKGGESIAQLSRAAIDGLGGMAAFVSQGATVCLKPNASWDRSPGIGATTHPDVFKELVLMCQEAGAGDIYAIDFPLASEPLVWNGLGPVAEEAGTEFIILTDTTDQMWETMEFPDGVRVLPEMGEEQVAYDFLGADVVINIPVLKSHSSTGVSIALKNLMGVIRDRGRYHGGGSGGYGTGGAEVSSDIHQAIADLGLMLKDKVSLTLVDCTYVLTDESGPRGREDIPGEPMMTCIAGTDMVACDYRAAQLFGLSDDQMSQVAAHIPLAAEIGAGTTDLASLKVNEVDLGGGSGDETEGEETPEADEEAS